MAHWSDYSLRGWLSFLAFMHLGLALRSLIDSNFLYEKILISASGTCKELLSTHLFAIYSIGQALILTQAAIHLYVLPVQLITIFFLFIFIVLVITEAFYYQMMDFYGATLLPFTMSVASFLFLIVFHFIWKPWLQYAIAEDSNLKSMFHEGKKKCRANSSCRMEPYFMLGSDWSKHRHHSKIN